MPTRKKAGSMAPTILCGDGVQTAGGMATWQARAQQFMPAPWCLSGLHEPSFVAGQAWPAAGP